MRADRHGRGGFTLIELMVVISIMIVLVGMLTPMLGMAQRKAARTNTFALMQKIGGALNQFRTDVGGHPFQAWDPSVNPPPTADTTPPMNQLAYRLCRNLTTDELTALRNDINAVGNAYESGGSAFIPLADFDMRNNTNGASGISTGYQHINRAAKQWATNNIMVGNIKVGKPTMSGTNPWVYGAPLLPNSSSIPNPPYDPLSNPNPPYGWGCDYLSRDIPPRNRRGNAILDMWGSPLVYICPVQPGIIGYYAEGLRGQYLDTGWFGLDPRSLRSTTLLLDSDIRTTAAARFTGSPELWSAGPDRVMSSHRPDPTNRDNIPALEYHKELQ